MELAITLTIVVIVLSILVGYSLFKGGKEMQNNNIKMAGVYWLLITTISIIMLIISTFMTEKEIRIVAGLSFVTLGLAAVFVLFRKKK